MVNDYDNNDQGIVVTGNIITVSDDSKVSL